MGMFILYLDGNLEIISNSLSKHVKQKTMIYMINWGIYIKKSFYHQNLSKTYSHLKALGGAGYSYMTNSLNCALGCIGTSRNKGDK